MSLNIKDSDIKINPNFTDTFWKDLSMAFQGREGFEYHLITDNLNFIIQNQDKFKTYIDKVVIQQSNKMKNDDDIFKAKLRVFVKNS